MNAPSTAWLAWAMVVLSAVFFGLGLVLLMLAPVSLLAYPSFFWPEALTSCSMVAYVALGALIALRRPQNPIGWIFCVMGFAWHVRELFVQYVAYAASAAPGAISVLRPIAWLPINLWLITFGLLPLLCLLFPTGRLTAPAWRAVVWLVR